MEELISENEIVKKGYKPETQYTYLKGKSRFVYCSACSKWNETKLQPSKDSHMLKFPCNWCNCSIGLIIKNG